MTLALKRPALRNVPTNARCLLYVRVSTDDQAREDKTSLADQERQCRELAERLGYPEAHVWADPGRSGRDAMRLEELASWCEANRRPTDKPGLIVYYHPSRWARFADPGDAIYYQQRCKHAGWLTRCVTLPDSGNKGMNLAMASMGHGAATADNDERIRRVMMGMEQNAAKGYWQGRAPFGYERVAVKADGTRRPLKPFQHVANDEHAELIPGDPADVRTVRRIFQRLKEGATCKAVAAELNADKVHGPFNVYRRTAVLHALKWRGCVVRAIAKNPVYGGNYIWKRRSTEESGKRGGWRPASEWRRIEGATTVPALVDRATFAAVQEEFKRRKKAKRVRSTEYLLTGLATCGRCGRPLVGGGGHAPNRFYKCAGGEDDKVSGPVCGPPRMTVNQVLLETEVVAQVGKRVKELVANGALAKVLDRLIGERGDVRKARNTLEQEQRALEAKRDRLLDAIADGTVKKDVAKGKLAELDAALARVDRDMHELRLEPSRAALVAERDRLLAMAADFPARLRRAPLVTRRALLAQWVSGLVVGAPARKGAPVEVRLTLRPVPAVGSQLARDTRAGQP